MKKTYVFQYSTGSGFIDYLFQDGKIEFQQFSDLADHLARDNYKFDSNTVTRVVERIYTTMDKVV